MAGSLLLFSSLFCSLRILKSVMDSSQPESSSISPQRRGVPWYTYLGAFLCCSILMSVPPVGARYMLALVQWRDWPDTVQSLAIFGGWTLGFTIIGCLGELASIHLQRWTIGHTEEATQVIDDGIIVKIYCRIAVRIVSESLWGLEAVIRSDRV